MVFAGRNDGGLYVPATRKPDSDPTDLALFVNVSVSSDEKFLSPVTGLNDQKISKTLSEP
jgi:hypothetical protein